MAESWRTEKKRPKIKVLPWPAVPPSTVDEMYAGVDEKWKEFALWVESPVRQQFNADKPESLNGIRVLDMTANQSIGHWCSSHFSEPGAEVIMVEPVGGDPLRKLTPFGREEYWNGIDSSVRPRYGNWDLAINIYAVNPCADGQIMVGGEHDRLWFRIWRATGLFTARCARSRKEE
jgi:crotonobetainyl-CoA:carnitine CoA-transferase CaiB-like acyl-CoA transferase